MKWILLASLILFTLATLNGFADLGNANALGNRLKNWSNNKISSSPIANTRIANWMINQRFAITMIGLALGFILGIIGIFLAN